MSIDRLSSKVDVDLINPKNNLLKAQKFADVLALLKQKVAEYPTTYIVKQCNEFILMVCKIIEELVVKADKINKKEMVVDLFKALFLFNETECNLLRNSIDFLHSNNMIQKIKTSKKMWSTLKKSVLSKKA